MKALAQTTFFVKSPREEISQVHLHLYEPVRDDSDTVSCSYTVCEDGVEPFDSTAYGATKWQALTLALSKLQLELRYRFGDDTLFRSSDDARDGTGQIDLSGIFGSLETTL